MALVRDDAGSLLAKAEAKELHELLAQQARRLRQYRVDEYGRLYTRDERKALIDRLRALLNPDPATRSSARQAADDLMRAPTTPSKQSTWRTTRTSRPW